MTTQANKENEAHFIAFGYYLSIVDKPSLSG